MSTLREHLEEIRDQTAWFTQSQREIWSHAVAALAILEEAREMNAQGLFFAGGYRHLPDPMAPRAQHVVGTREVHQHWRSTCACGWRSEGHLHRVIHEAQEHVAEAKRDPEQA